MLHSVLNMQNIQHTFIKTQSMRGQRYLKTNKQTVRIEPPLSLFVSLCAFVCVRVITRTLITGKVGREEVWAGTRAREACDWRVGRDQFDVIGWEPLGAEGCAPSSI